MIQVEHLDTIVTRMREQGVERPVHEAVIEWHRQSRQALREAEDGILVAAQASDASDYLREVAIQIEDHRAAGHYTTQG